MQCHSNPRNEGGALPRLVWADCLRIVASFAVVLLHVASDRISHATGELSVMSDLLPLYVYRTIPSFAVPCFFMLSGMFFLDPARSVSRGKIVRACLRMLLVFSIWSLFYSMGFPTATHRPFVHELVKGHYHLWFLPALASCYLAIPALRMIAKENGSVANAVFAAVFLVFVPATVRSLSRKMQLVLPESTAIAVFSYPAAYFLFGCWLNRARTPVGSIRRILPVGILGFAMSLALTIWCRVRTGANDACLGGNHLGVFLFSLAVFAGFRMLGHFKWFASPRPWLSTFSNLTLGVYLIHPAVLSLLPAPQVSSPWVAVPAKTAVAYFASSLLVFLLKKSPVLRFVV